MSEHLKSKEISIGWDVGGWSGKNHGFCALEYNGSEIKLLMSKKLTIYQIKETVEGLFYKYENTHKITLGVDAPLQFPQLFTEIITQQATNIFNRLHNEPGENPIAWRATDLIIKKHFKKTPLSASFSFLTSNATVAISLLEELKSKFNHFSVLPFDEEKNINAIEVYPGLLKSLTLSNNLNFDSYRQLLSSEQFNKIEGFDYYFNEAKEKTDVADAVICALYGLGLSGKITLVPKLNKMIPTHLMEIAKKEGWIYYPDIF